MESIYKSDVVIVGSGISGLMTAVSLYPRKVTLVTKRKLGNAVNRNKIKRRLRNIMDDAVKKISLKYDYSYLVIAKPTMLHNDFKIIKNTLFQDFERIK